MLGTLYSGIYVYAYIYTCITTISLKKGHEFEREQEWIYGKVQMEENEGRNVLIML